MEGLIINYDGEQDSGFDDNIIQKASMVDASLPTRQ